MRHRQQAQIDSLTNLITQLHPGLKVFVVGDRKQSIYSFQGADPEEFENMRRYFAQKLAPLNSFEEVHLDISFRSTAAILDTGNQVFSLPQAKKGVVPDTQDMTHTPSRIGDGGKVEIWSLLEAEEDENPESMNVQ